MPPRHCSSVDRGASGGSRGRAARRSVRRAVLGTARGALSPRIRARAFSRAAAKGHRGCRGCHRGIARTGSNAGRSWKALTNGTTPTSSIARTIERRSGAPVGPSSAPDSDLSGASDEEAAAARALVFGLRERLRFRRPVRSCCNVAPLSFRCTDGPVARYHR